MPNSKINKQDSLQGSNHLIGMVVDPTVTAVEAPKGTVLIRLSIGSPGNAIGFYQKQDDGKTTNWVEISGGGGGLIAGDYIVDSFSVRQSHTSQPLPSPPNKSLGGGSVEITNFGSTLTTSVFMNQDTACRLVINCGAKVFTGPDAGKVWANTDEYIFERTGAAAITLVSKTNTFLSDVGALGYSTSHTVGFFSFVGGVYDSNNHVNIFNPQRGGNLADVVKISQDVTVHGLGSSVAHKKSSLPNSEAPGRIFVENLNSISLPADLV